MIEVENLSKRYGDKLAVDDLSFTVQPGIVTGFLGPNGAGKSTTMRMIAGLDRPTTGQVRVNGLDYRDACKMGANGSAQTTNRRTAQHGSVALTWENTTGDHRTPSVITGRVLLLICGFGVQVPGGAPCLTWPFAVSRPPARATSDAVIGQMRAGSEQRSHASRQRSEICGCEARRRPSNMARLDGDVSRRRAPV